MDDNQTFVPMSCILETGFETGLSKKKNVWILESSKFLGKKIWCTFQDGWCKGKEKEELELFLNDLLMRSCRRHDIRAYEKGSDLSAF
jgi:hypothetical protein